ncbi:phage tail fiber protein [Aquitalea magnusonii]|uniref:Phage tail fiber protein n=1 Tax=Aquitalea magnusonii TaxID=332411 RepID=A0A3G9GF41_9NEIS|nr:tail fiber protein [Aquitalea magnusonii]BBF84871.1 phage tail fiber protein [Aquitalea magnusonii]
MQKINTPDNLFHDGDPSSGALGTIVTAAWLNAMQGELVSVIEAAGIKLDAAKTDQLRLAIAKLVSDAAAPLKHGHAWADVSKTPTTLAGYGITDALPLKPLLGAKVDLDGIISTGWYHQSLNSNAASGSNYPTPTAGMLSVYASDTMVYQLYQDFQGKRLWWRVQYNDTWSAWQSGATLDDIATTVPAGHVSFFARSSAPPGYLKANGAALSRSAYANLFAAIGTTFGAGDGASTFNLPDLRGEFVRGFDDGRSVDPGRLFGSAQADELRSHYHEYRFVGSASSSTPDDYVSQGGSWPRNFPGSTGRTGGIETRPRNIALLACIKF